MSKYNSQFEEQNNIIDVKQNLLYSNTNICINGSVDLVIESSVYEFKANSYIDQEDFLDFYNNSDEYEDFFYCSNPDNFKDITKFYDNPHKKVMDMIVNEQKRRNIRSLLLISYKRRQHLHEDM